MAEAEGFSAETRLEVPDRSSGWPADLREWVAADRLKEWVEQEVDRLDGQASPSGGDLRGDPALRPKLPLKVLAFAYAARIFSAEEIVQACHSDPILQSLCEGEVPFVQELRNFRRSHRPVLEAILAAVCLRALGERFDLEPSRVPPELERDVRERAGERLDIARHMDVAA